MALAETLNEFCGVFGRNNLDLGDVFFNRNSFEKDVSESLNLTGQIKDFYSLLDFDELIIGGAFFTEIFSLERLPKAQIGWRWIVGSDNQTTEDTENWSGNWLVFGDRNGDAVFVKTDNLLSPVYGTIQKTRNFQLADSLENFFNIINECLIIEEKDFNLETQNEDFEIKPEFLARVNEVINKFAPENKDDFIEFFFG